MMDVKLQLIGYKNIKRKADGKDMTIATCVAECSPVDNSHGAFGAKAVDYFLPDALVGSLKPDAIGKQFVPSYELNGFGRPALSDYSLK